MNITDEEYKLDYNLDDYQTIKEVSNKILEINLKKTTVLEKYKNSNKVLPIDIYNKTVDNINSVFDGYLTPLEIRRQKILSGSVLAEQTACKLDKLKTIKRMEIESAFQNKTLRFENSLFKKRCRIQYRINKAKALAQFKMVYGVKINVPSNPYIITDGSFMPP